MQIKIICKHYCMSEITNNLNNIENINKMIDDEINKIIDIKTIHEKDTLVLSGGGIKGIAHIGGLCALDEQKLLHKIKNIAGCSIGAVIGFLIIIGYAPKELYEFVIMFDFNKIKSIDLKNIFKNFGLDNGDKSLTVLKMMMDKKNIKHNITFLELFKLTNIYFITVAACLNNKQAYYHSYKTFPDMCVLQALRMSFSIPLFFSPVNYNGNLYVDGGCIDNFPVKYFDKDVDRVLGFYLTDCVEYTKEINNTEEFLVNLIDCIKYGLEENQFYDNKFDTIVIKLYNCNSLQPNISNKKKEEIYMCGYKAVIEQIKKFNI